MALPQITIQNSKVAFAEILVEMMTRLDDMMEKYSLQDGDYKEFAEDLMKLKNLQADMRPNHIYTQIERRVRRPRQQAPPPPSLEKKMTSPDYDWCKFCNTPIKTDKKNKFMILHQQSSKCSQIAQTKRTTMKRPIFQNVNYDKPLQVINRCLWRRYRNEHGNKDYGHYYWFRPEYREAELEWNKTQNTKWEIV